MTINSDDYAAALDLVARDHDLCYLIDYRDGSIRLYLRHESERGSRPMWVHHGHGVLRHVTHVQALDATRLGEVLDAVTPELGAVLATYHSEWDDNAGHDVGSVDGEALDWLEEAMSAALSTVDLARVNENAGLWESAEWLDGLGRAGTCAEYGIAATTTDPELDAIASQIALEASSEGVKLSGLDEHLVSLRSELRWPDAVYAVPVVTVVEVADMLGVTRRRAHQLVVAHPDSRLVVDRWLIPATAVEDLRARRTKRGPEKRVNDAP